MIKYKKLPGHVLVEDFMVPAGLDISDVSRISRVPWDIVNGIVRGQKPIDERTAKSFARLFNNKVEFWLDLQSKFTAGEAL